MLVNLGQTNSESKRSSCGIVDTLKVEMRVTILSAISIVQLLICRILGQSTELISITAHNKIKKCKHGTYLLNDFDVDISKHMNLYGEWAEQELQLFLRLIKPGDIVIDAGANIGAFTVPFAKAAGERGHVHAFEPQKIINQRLNANVAINELYNVDVYLAALGNETGSIKVPVLNYLEDSNFGALSLAARYEGQTDKWSYDVPLLTLDSIDFFNVHTGESCPTFIKMDVELMERSVLHPL